MRNPNRIFEFCDELATLWYDRVPDWRFGQLMCNVLGQMAGEGRDPFFPEEDEMIEYIRKFFHPNVEKIHPNVEEIMVDRFQKEYCMMCGSQRCEGPGTEWFDGCIHKEKLRLDK